MTKFDVLKINVQEIIDTIADKNFEIANNKLRDVKSELNDLLDFTDNENDLIEISRYQVLLNQLQRKIINEV
jgi:CII-binding regulator of phage lambda lysogenization HflD